MAFWNRNLIGIDIGTYSIKTVLLHGGPGAYKLRAADVFRLSSDGGQTFSEVSPALLSGILSAMKIREKGVAALAQPSAVSFRHLSLPVMPDKDLLEAVKWELRKETGIPAPDLVSDYVHTGTKAGENSVSVIAFSAKKSDMEQFMGFFRSAGLDVRVIESVPTALFASFDVNSAWEDGVNYAMLDIGENKSTLVILKNRRLVFAREIAFGGRELTVSVAEVLEKEYPQAEEYKIAWGLNTPEEDGDDARKCLEIPVTELCRELHRSFDYYQAQFREGPVKKVFLSGGTARLKGLDAFMSESIGVPCFVDDPLRNVKGGHDREKLRDMAPCLTVAVGLAAKKTDS